MQMKKSPREGQYADSASRYDNERFSADNSDGYGDYQPEPLPARGGGRAVQNPGAGADDRATAGVRAESLIDKHSTFDGRYETDQDLRVEGSISGEVICRGTLTIEKEASARARINARDAHIKGRLEGDVVCSGKLLLAATAMVTGTLKAPVLVVEEGATLSGSVDTTQKGIADAAPARPTASPAKAVEEAPARETPAAAAPRAPRREVPSFAIVSSEASLAGERH